MIVKNNKKVLTLTVGCIASLTLVGSALGQELTSGQSSLEGKEEAESVGVIKFSPTYTHLFEADGDNGFGNVTVDRIGGRLGYGIKSGETEFGFGGLYEYAKYQFNTISDQEVNRIGGNAFYKSMANENWGYFGYGGLEAAASTEADLDDGFIGTIAAGARYVWSPTLSLGFGAAFANGIEADDRVMPVIILNWQINEHWSLRTLNGATVAYDLNADKKTVFDAGINYQYREYRTQGSSSSVVEKYFVIELGVTHRFTKEFSMRAFAGVTGGREFEVYNNGSKTVSPDVDSGPIAGISATFAF